MSELNYEHVFDVLVDKTAEYVTENNLKAMVLGISGGIDSTVVAAICHEVSKKTGIPLIGRSLPIKNKSDEFATSVHVGEAFCNEFSVYRLERSYRAALFDACADAGDVNMANSYYLDELEDALIIPVYNDLLDPSGNFQIWTPEPIARIYLDDCIKYIGEDTKDLKYGDLLCVYSMTLSEHSLYAIQLSNYKLHKLDTSVCALEGKGYALAKDTKVKVVLDSAYTEVGQTGKIYRTDYRSALPYEVIIDKGDCVWVAGCTIQNVDTEVYIEEYSADVENEVSPDKDILENGFSRQVTFYEKD